MDDLKQYTVHINGIPHTMLLSDEDAKLRGVFQEPKAKPESSKPKSK